MKSKLALMNAMAIVSAIAIFPVACQAQNTETMGSFIAQADVELTPKQKAQLTQIRKNTRSQIESILTPKQQGQYKAAIEGNKEPQAAIAALNLSQNQKKELRQILQSERQQVSSILTPEQQQQMRRNAQLRWN
jgi:Spy/CpxP family protein refolding chaperone